MLIIPAIDIQDGCVVRLVQGRLDKKIYSKDPVKTAKHWARQGAQLLHVVDLDGAMSGSPKNIGIAAQVIKEAGIPVEFGGGVRSLETIGQLLDAGAARVILGTKAAQEPEFLRKAFKKLGDKLIVSIDARDGIVMIEGWQEGAKKSLQAIEFASQLKQMGLKQVVYTDVSKDGTLKGPNIADTKKVLKTGISVIASGGISSLDDLIRLKALEKEGLTGVIIGKALYEGKFTLSQALKL